MNIFRFLIVPTVLLMLALSFSACTSHQVEVKPVEIKPIHITIDINVRVDKALDDYFNDLDDGAVQDKELSPPEE